MGWAGCLAGRNHREQRVEQCCRFRGGLELFPHLSKTGYRFQALGWMLQKEILSFFRAARL